MGDGIKNKKLSQWKRCADLAITCNGGETVRRCIFNNANYNHWQVSGKIIKKMEKCFSGEASTALRNLSAAFNHFSFYALRLVIVFLSCISHICNLAEKKSGKVGTYNLFIIYL